LVTKVTDIANESKQFHFKYICRPHTSRKSLICLFADKVINRSDTLNC